MKGDLRRELRLHIGCGTEAIPGWINIDNRPLPGVDRVLDVRRGLLIAATEGESDAAMTTPPRAGRSPRTAGSRRPVPDPTRGTGLSY